MEFHAHEYANPKSMQSRSVPFEILLIAVAGIRLKRSDTFREEGAERQNKP